MKKIWVMMIATVLLAACNNQSVPADSGINLEDTRWKLTFLSTMPSGLPSLQKEVFLQMNDGKANGNAGCNSYFGGYTTIKNEIHFTGIGSTKMFCQQGMEVENNLLQSLGAADNYRFVDKQLELLKGTEVLARFEISKG